VRSAEGSGRTVEEAIRDALRVLGAKRDDVDLMVLDEGTRGVLGLGAREARVRLTLLSEEAEDDIVPEAEAAASEAGDPISTARNVTSSLINAMGFRGVVNASEDDGAVLVSIAGANLAPLIGRRGQTLEALELLVNAIVGRRLGHRVPVIVDAERYRERRREALINLARRTATRVERTGEPVPLEPMSPSERRVIHTTLADEVKVATHSEGEGPNRHVVITLRGADNGSVHGTPRGAEDDVDDLGDPEPSGDPQD